MLDELTNPEVQAFIQKNLNEDPAALMLQASKYPDMPMRTVVEQIQSRKKAKAKLPSWEANPELIFPPAISMEQASSEQTASYKASLVDGKLIADLTGGFGVDLAFLSSRFEKVVYVEQQVHLVELAMHNFSALGLTNLEVVESDSIQWLSESEQHFDWVYLDPARRDGYNQKVVRLEDCTPDLVALLPVLKEKTKKVMVKTSPLLDIKGAIRSLESVFEVHVLAVENEVKELLFLMDFEASVDEPTIHCVHLRKDKKEALTFHFSEEEMTQVTFGLAEKFLYEPNASLMKGGAFKTVAERLGLRKIHPNTHLYTSTERVSNFPGRAFEIIRPVSINKKALAKVLPAMKANLTVRNFPMTVAQIRKKTGLKEGGEDYIFAFRDQNGPCAFLCRKC